MFIKILFINFFKLEINFYYIFLFLQVIKLKILNFTFKRKLATL